MKFLVRLGTLTLISFDPCLFRVSGTIARRGGNGKEGSSSYNYRSMVWLHRICANQIKELFSRHSREVMEMLNLLFLAFGTSSATSGGRRPHTPSSSMITPRSPKPV